MGLETFWVLHSGFGGILLRTGRRFKIRGQRCSGLESLKHLQGDWEKGPLGWERRVGCRGAGWVRAATMLLFLHLHHLRSLLRELVGGRHNE